MRCVCMYCNFLYNVKEPCEDESETHGLCDECFSWVKMNLTKDGGEGGK